MYSRAKRGAKRQAREHLAFYRDDEQGYLGGVCAGIADKMNWDVTMVRVVTVLLGLVLTLPTLITYIAATFVLRKKNLAFYGRDEKGFWRSASRREQAPYPQHDATFTDEENE
ncbi:MAG: PspC domain-containing protein [Gammaproteobacteria bacterium]|nr:PspC domain-containing protein [Gammaproteobacteria bacterium]NNC97775.1 PspC domain-containing protein [Gammaproteobacteria bacterium]NNM14142.1 PspC domain-containing protein [Gammaproteobacteria bacterium]